MAVAGKKALWKLLQHKKLNNRLVVTPLLEESQVGDATIDLRLGNDFIVTRKGNLPSIDPAHEDTRKRRYQSRYHVSLGDMFHLHPGELVLGATFEYIRVPKSHFGFVASRSSWGRMGLIIATAITIAPGFTGVITLELINVGEVPLVLYPGIIIAQLVIQDCSGATGYQGKFSCFTQPEFGSVNKDKHIEFFTKSRRG